MLRVVGSYELLAVWEKGCRLKPSLCMILPLRNDADRVSHIFSQAIEILPELTPRWKLVLFDDGSADATGEILAELVRALPQAAVHHNSTAAGDRPSFARVSDSATAISFCCDRVNATWT